MINGRMFRDGVISGANNISNSRQAVDALNIFPVPDGDTGTNMSMTINAAANEIKDMPDDSDLGDVAKKVSSALLRGARGNSGVILSLIFRGFSKAFKGLSEAGSQDIANAFRAGTDAAYKAVMKPTEGTILTVVRCAAEAAEKMAKIQEDPLEVCLAALEAAKEALAKTPEMLPVLKKAGVVDAGGQGFLLILQGIQSVFENDVIITPIGEEQKSEKKEAVASEQEEIKFGYCSEFLIKKERDAKEKDPLKLRAYLESIGDCVVVVDDTDIIKVHVHSNCPGTVIQTGLKYGSLINIKIDNMREQRETIEAQKSEPAPQEDEILAPENEYGFVSVCAGDGLALLFSDLGCDVVVSGGQTMNPSTDDIAKAVLKTPAKVVYVLPNNKNIIMAAQMAKNEVEDREIVVLETKTIPQGIAAMLVFDDTVSKEENLDAMMEAAGNIKTGTVTFAARDSEVDGKPIKQGQIMGLCNGAIKFVDDDKQTVAVATTKELFDADTNYLITVFYGEEISEDDAQALEEKLHEEFGEDVEISLIEGGQPIYYYIISVE